MARVSLTYSPTSHQLSGGWKWIGQYLPKSESQEQDFPEEDSLKGMELLAEADSFWFEQSEEKRHQMVVETANAAFITISGSPVETTQMMFRLGYYYGRKEE